MHRVPRFGIKTIFEYQKALDGFFNTHSEYKIIHGHMLSTAFIYQGIAKSYNVPIRIAHSRCGSRTQITPGNMVKEFFKRLTRFYVNEQFAVSKTAAVSAFGTRSLKQQKVRIIPNGIKTSNYLFNHVLRSKVRKEMDLDGKFVVGHIGRFQEQKNHDFIIDIFKQIIKRHSNSVLVLVGNGELKDKIEDKVCNLGLTDCVIFTGVRSDVPMLLQAMDVLLFPSLFEGLPGVVLEAQAAGLPCVISDRITDEVKLTDLVEYHSLNRGPEYWASKVLNYFPTRERLNMYNEIVEAGFDIESVANWYEHFYLNRLSEEDFEK